MDSANEKWVKRNAKMFMERDLSPAEFERVDEVWEKNKGNSECGPNLGFLEAVLDEAFTEGFHFDDAFQVASLVKYIRKNFTLDITAIRLIEDFLNTAASPDVKLYGAELLNYLYNQLNSIGISKYEIAGAIWGDDFSSASEESRGTWIISLSNNACSDEIVNYSVFGYENDAKRAVRALFLQSANLDRDFMDFSYDGLAASLDWDDYRIVIRAEKLSNIRSIQDTVDVSFVSAAHDMPESFESDCNKLHDILDNAFEGKFEEV